MPKWEHLTPVLIKNPPFASCEIQGTIQGALTDLQGLYGLASPYIADLLKPHEPERDLRSADQNLLEVPKTKYCTAGNRAFSKSGPRVVELTPAVIVILHIPWVFQEAAQNILVLLCLRDWVIDRWSAASTELTIFSIKKWALNFVLIDYMHLQLSNTLSSSWAGYSTYK